MVVTLVKFEFNKLYIRKKKYERVFVMYNAIHPDKSARGFIFFLFFCGYNEENGIYTESHKVE